jgi:hypothetical protein
MDPGEVNFFDKNVADVINLDLKRFLFFQTCHKNILQNRKADPGLAKRRNTFESQSSDLCTYVRHFKWEKSRYWQNT